MLEPIDAEKNNDKDVKMDREVLHSMMKSWLTPRPTGILFSPETPDSTKKKISESDQSAEKKNNYFI